MAATPQERKKYIAKGREQVEELDVMDVSGAGDTFMAALAVKYTETEDMILSIGFANQCASHVVKKKGTTVA